MDMHEPQPLPFYNSWTEKEEYFEITKVDNIEDLIEIIESLDHDNYIYRGVNNWKYKMLSSYHRFLYENEFICKNERSFGESKFIKKYLKEIVGDEDFVSNALKIADNYNTTKSGEYRIDGSLDRYLFTCISKLQHYKNFSFLLDFSIDPYIALFFSIYQHSDSEYISLIYFPKNLMNYLDLEREDELVQVYSTRKQFRSYIEDHRYLHARLKNLSDHFLLDYRPLLVKHKEEYISNVRQNKQKGCFVLYDPNHLCEPDKSPVEERLKRRLFNTLNENEIKPYSVEIHSKLVPEIERLLNKKGITEDKLGLTEQ